jgi:peptidoglycan/xylan/chitin deacetylase (PgdA/CDA1 family)
MVLERIPILAYHKVDTCFEWGVTRVLPSQFSEQMRFLDTRGFRVTPLSYILEEEISERTIVLTFDDAYESLYHNAFEVMKEYGFTATVFVVSDFVGKKNLWDVTLGREFIHLDWGGLQELVKEGFEIGSHTHTHPDLTKVSEDRVRDELEISKKTLEDHLGVPVRFVSYPFGRYSKRVKEIARECGYRGGVCLSHPFKRGFDILEIDREGIYIFDTIDDFKAKLHLCGSTLYRYQKIKGRIINFFAGATFTIKRVQNLFAR